MEIDIKCLECGKGTRNFQLGNLFYCLKRPTETAVIKEVIFCPKCGLAWKLNLISELIHKLSFL